MKVEEMYVSITQAERIFEVINQSLSVTKYIQIFVTKELIEELQRNGAEHHVYPFNGPCCFHYNKDDDKSGGEIWYGYHESDLSSPLVFSASFISNCSDYYQLVNFPSANYLHFTAGFKKLLLIEANTTAIRS